MKKSTLMPMVAAACFLTPLAACGTAQTSGDAVDTAAVADEVQLSVDRTVAAFVARDVAGSTDNLADDYVGIFHGEPNGVGKAAEVAITTQQVADPALNLTVDNQSIDVANSGDLAVYSATYAYDFTNPDTAKVATETGNWILIFKRQADGSMKVVKGIVSDTPAPVAAPDKEGGA